MKPSRAVARGITYVVLTVGAAVFAFPFLWMAATSMKVDREMMSAEFRVLPVRPRPALRSPYVDRESYGRLTGPAQAELQARLRTMIADTDFEIPSWLDRAATEEQLARGLYARLRRRLRKQTWEGRHRLPDGTWAGPGDIVEAVIEAAGNEVTAATVAEVFDRVYRRALIGRPRARTYARQEVALVPHTGATEAPVWECLTPETASLEPCLDAGRPYALVRYDFSGGNNVRIANTFRVPEGFDLAQLHQVQLPVRPDDSWHELRVIVETPTAVYTSTRAYTLGNFDPGMVIWQPPGPDDSSTRIKTWIRLTGLRDNARPAVPEGCIRLTLDIERAGNLKACWNKMRSNYDRVFDHMPFWRYLRVSVFLVVANILLALVFSSLVAYAFARLTWPGRDLCFVLMLATMMIPFQVIMIPRFLIWKNLGAYNTLTPLWLGPAFGNAFFVFLLRQFMKGIPRDLEDAARIDGCGFLRIYWYILLPLVKPSLAAIAVFTFIGTWNNFMGPLLYIADQRLYPLAFGLYAFSVQVANNPALTMAGSLLMTVPVIVVFFFAQKYFIQGIALTGIKQ